MLFAHITKKFFANCDKISKNYLHLINISINLKLFIRISKEPVDGNPGVKFSDMQNSLRPFGQSIYDGSM